jgi:hypothetical protein
LKNRDAEEKNFKAKFAVIPPFKPKPKNPVPAKVEEQKLKPPEEMKVISDNTTDKNSGRSASNTSSKGKGLKFSKFRVKGSKSLSKDNSVSDNASNRDICIGGEN